MKIVRLKLQENTTNWFEIILNKKQFGENNQKDWYINPAIVNVLWSNSINKWADEKTEKLI